jgi:hypothetical protein
MCDSRPRLLLVLSGRSGQVGSGWVEPGYNVPSSPSLLSSLYDKKPARVGTRWACGTKSQLSALLGLDPDSFCHLMRHTRWAKGYSSTLTSSVLVLVSSPAAPHLGSPWPNTPAK